MSILNLERQNQKLTFVTSPCLFTAALIILSNQFFDFVEIPNSETVISHAFSIMQMCSTRNPIEESEFHSLRSLHQLINKQGRQSLLMDRPAFRGTNPYGGYGVASESRTNPVFATPDFATARCKDPTCCGSDGHRDSIWPIQSLDHIEIPQLNSCSGTMQSMNHPYHENDAGCYALAVPQGGYEGEAIQLTQEYTAFQGQQPYLP